VSVENLAILGGTPAVTAPPPHFRWPLRGEEESAAVLEILNRGELSYPRRIGAVAALEEAFANLVGLPYAVSCHSGSGAIHASYFALDLPAGSEVLVPAYTHLATALPMIHVGLEPVLCDIDPETGNLDAKDAATRVTPDTSAIAYTHQYGHSCDTAALAELAQRYALRLLADCSHAHGSTIRGRHLGTEADVACFSLQAHKTVNGGEGGILLTRDERIAERAALLGHFREHREFTSAELAPFVETGLGLKSRLHPVAAALSLVSLRKLPQTIRARHENYESFKHALADVPGIRVPGTAPHVDRGGYFRFIVFYEPEALDGLSIERYVEALRAEGVAEVQLGSLVRPLHTYKIFQDEGLALRQAVRSGRPAPRSLRSYRAGDFPAAEAFSAKTLQFPAFTEPAQSIIEQYAAAMRKLAAQHWKLV
jgi:dTDP-4-amino-4,6-dideoxygalactose transaminase